MDVAELPFNQFVGIASSEVDGRGVVVLEPGPRHCNHIGTVHAAVLYGVAEAAAGQCLLSHFPDLTESAVVVLRSSAVKYRKPAAADGMLIAAGNLEEDAADRYRSQFAARGRGLVDVRVSVRQGDVEVLTGTFSWFAAQPSSRQFRNWPTRGASRRLQLTRNAVSAARESQISASNKSGISRMISRERKGEYPEDTSYDLPFSGLRCLCGRCDGGDSTVANCAGCRAERGDEGGSAADSAGDAQLSR